MAKNVLITGSSAGIGAEIASLLAKEDYKILLTGRNEERLKELANTYSLEYFVADLHQPGAVADLYDEAVKSLGVIDILVNNAGEYVWSPIEKTDKDSIQKLFKLNLQVPFELSQMAVPSMKEKKWGRIINIGSISGVVGEANASLYSASKAGLIGLTKSLALEIAEYGITVNMVNPGWVKTELPINCFEEGCLDEEEQISMVPQQRWIHPSEVADLVKYLVSNSARGVTGQLINLCAGLSLG